MNTNNMMTAAELCTIQKVNNSVEYKTKKILSYLKGRLYEEACYGNNSLILFEDELYYNLKIYLFQDGKEKDYILKTLKKKGYKVSYKNHVGSDHNEPIYKGWWIFKKHIGYKQKLVKGITISFCCNEEETSFPPKEET